MPRPTAVTAALRFRNQLAAQEADAAERMGMIYARIHAGMQDDLQALADEIAGMDDPSRGKIYKLARTQRLIRQVEDQATRFGVVVQNEVGIISTRAIEQGTSDTLKLIEASLPELPPALRGQIVASFTTLPAPAIEAAAGLIAADSPLTERLSSAYGEFVAQSFSDHLTEGIAKGQNPRRVASLLDRNSLAGLGRGLTSALTTVRTAQIKSYQIANQANMMANRRIVPEWTWVATLDSRTCMSCVAQHGSVHPVDEALNDHHNGRCVPVPRTISYRDLGIDLPDPVEPFEGGEDWFNRQTQATQRQLMGSGIYEAWKAGRFKFADLSQRYDDPVYGELLRETTLKELTGKSTTAKTPQQKTKSIVNDVLNFAKQDEEEFEAKMADYLRLGDEIQLEISKLLKQHKVLYDILLQEGDADTEKLFNETQKRLDILSDRMSSEVFKPRRQLIDEYYKDAPQRLRGKLLYVDDPSVFNAKLNTRGISKERQSIWRKGIDEFKKLVSNTVGGNIKVEIGPTPSTAKGRSYASGSTQIRMGKTAQERVVIHELGHILEDTNPKVSAAARKFLEDRTKGEEAQPLLDITGNKGYRSSEIAKKDKFISPYMGKIYSFGSTEIISMGVEYFWAEPAKFAKDDPEYFDFIYNILRGL